jgi:hypothetical protein
MNYLAQYGTSLSSNNTLLACIADCGAIFNSHVNAAGNACECNDGAVPKFTNGMLVGCLLSNASRGANDSATVVAREWTNIDVLANDGGAYFNITGITKPAKGYAVVAKDPTGRAIIRYASRGNLLGADSLTYTAATAAGSTSTATVRVNITAGSCIPNRCGSAGKQGDNCVRGRCTCPSEWGMTSTYAIDGVPANLVAVPACRYRRIIPKGNFSLTGMTVAANATFEIAFRLSEASGCLPAGPLQPTVAVGRRLQCVENAALPHTNMVAEKHNMGCTDCVYSAAVTVPKPLQVDRCFAVVVMLGDSTRKVSVVTVA